MIPLGQALYEMWRQAIAKAKPGEVAGPVTVEWEHLAEWEREAWQATAEEFNE
jgi:hypothetical protein